MVFLVVFEKFVVFDIIVNMDVYLYFGFEEVDNDYGK